MQPETAANQSEKLPIDSRGTITASISHHRSGSAGGSTSRLVRSQGGDADINTSPLSNHEDEMCPDVVNLYSIWNETNNRLDLLTRRVEQGEDVMAASEFARWVVFSGILELLEKNPQKPPLTVDGALLRWKCGELIYLCGQVFNKNPSLKPPSYLEGIYHKLELIAGHLSKFTPPLAGTTEVGNTTPALVVVQGGLANVTDRKGIFSGALPHTAGQANCACGLGSRRGFPWPQFKQNRSSLIPKL